MDNKKKYAYWVMLSDYDIDTIDCLVTGERWVYVAYLCQQAIERQLKGMYVYYLDAEAPKTHNVNFLFSKIAGCERIKSHPEYERFTKERAVCEDFLIDVMFYFLSDYPFSYKNIMNRFIDKESAVVLVERTMKNLSWLRSFQPEPDKETTGG